MRKLVFLFLTLFPLILFAQKSTKRPNIILIMADDVGWECFGSYGAEDYETPNIDALAKQGVQFTNSYSTPLCTPSRVKIMTGKYNFRNYTHFGYLNPKEKTFGQLLQNTGYKTAIAGKWQLNGIYHNAEGSTDNTRPYKAGFDEYCLWQLTLPVIKRGERASERFWSPPLEKNGKILTTKENHELYGPDIMSDFVCDFIERNQDNPFFVYYPTVLVHDPFVPTPDTIGDKTKTQIANQAPKSKEEKKANFVAMVNYLDKIVGKIVKQVEKIGELENTIILFTADNGTNRNITSRWNNQDIGGGKGTTTNMGTHVPLIAYWKGHTKETIVDDLIDFTDFYTTIADLAKVELGSDDPKDGYSFLPQILGEKTTARNWQFCHYQPYWGKFKGTQYVRNKTYKLYRDNSFYNIANDIKEQHNIMEGFAGSKGETARKSLKQSQSFFPPAPPISGGKEIKTRPIYKDWEILINPND